MNDTATAFAAHARQEQAMGHHSTATTSTDAEKIRAAAARILFNTADAAEAARLTQVLCAIVDVAGQIRALSNELTADPDAYGILQALQCDIETALAAAEHQHRLQMYNHAGQPTVSAVNTSTNSPRKTSRSGDTHARPT